ncbi:helix-turn-helix domain-containing protein [Leptospira santarosai]|uniref:DNA-binding helix-turn-helix protein n=1 Tax=Leptospira santarosai serovar Arenal str. MAVJ 401 TaxID=1049976 RepID=M6JU58_9LEPT|nr:helix-turn-helix transcriptional regulator [Leptospira santarosai]EMN23125.1 DNA-binding helix-turn-helix protein [Leptospira santarosai serovar Arenal str. MAVJ 401]MDI7225540.1 helix-turn-helix transcriptional regulator [Leptospira santarosai]
MKEDSNNTKAEELNKYVSIKIKHLRENHNGGKGISQSELGRQIGENSNTISRWETGEYKPTTTDLWNLSIFFKIPISFFFFQKEEPTEFRIMLQNCLTKKDKEEIRNFIQFKIWMRSPDRKKIGRKRSGNKS